MPRSRDDLAARLNVAIVHFMRALRQTGPRVLAAEHQSTLNLVVHRGPMPIGELARLENVTAPAMTKAIGKLEERGLVTRERASGDLRVVSVRATRAGRALILRGREQQVSRIRDALARLRPDARAQLPDLLQTLEAVVSELFTDQTQVRSAAKGRRDTTRRRSSTSNRGK